VNSIQHSEDSSANEIKKPGLLKRGLLLYAAAILAASWSYGLWQIRVDRQLTLAASTNQLTMTASALASHVIAMLNDGVGAAVAGSNETNETDRAPQLPNDQVSAVLSRMLTGGDYVRALFIATPTRYVTAYRDNRETDVQRPAWLTELFKATGPTWIGHPLRTEQGDARVLIPVAKRIADRHGEVAWAGTLLSVDSLDAMYRHLPTEYSTVSLITFGGVLLIRIPVVAGTNRAGMSVEQYEAFRLYMKGPLQHATLDGPDPLSGKQRQFAAGQIEGYPFFAVASRNVEDSLIAWRARTRNSLIMLMVASATLIGLTTVLHTVLQRRFEALRRSEERFQLAVNGTNDGIWDWAIQSNRIYYSPRYKQLLGNTTDDDFPPLTEMFWQQIHPDDLRHVQLAVDRHLLHRDPYDVEYRLQVHDSGYRWFRARAQAIWDQRGEAIRMAGSISDIHDQKLAEQSLAQARAAELQAREEFAQQLLLAQEQERQRLANELHDSVGQSLSLIKNRVLLVLQQPNLPTAAAYHANALSELATEVIADVRTVAQNLRPLHIEELGITDALHTLLKKISESSGLLIDSRLENVDDVILDDDATHVYRIVQEAFNNILKHAYATQCRVTLERDVHCVRLYIHDNGIGFDSSAGRTAGLGLASMLERVRMLSAVWKIASTSGNGTSIHIEIPTSEVAGAHQSTIYG
jgi:two-component system, NarL family, sensor histidine kinase UhpB